MLISNFYVIIEVIDRSSSGKCYGVLLFCRILISVITCMGLENTKESYTQRCIYNALHRTSLLQGYFSYRI